MSNKMNKEIRKKTNSKILNIVKYTFEKSIRNKWFVILNIILLLVTIIGVNFGTVKQILKEKDISFSDKKLKIEVVDNNNLIFDNLVEAFSTEEFANKVEINKSNLLEYDEATLEKERLLVEVIESKENMIDLKIVSKEGIDSEYINVIKQEANDKKNELYASKFNLNEENIEMFLKDVSVERIMVGVDSENSNIKVIFQTVVNYLILFVLMLVLSKIANDVSQEKISKSIEYVLTTISAKAYLIAKVLSINLTLIAQFILGIVYLIIGTLINSLLNMFVISSNSISSGLELDVNLNLSEESLLGVFDINIILYIAVIFVFALITVFILCIIQAALSSKTTNISEAGNATILLVVINLIIYTVSSLVISPLKEVNVFMYILSCVPVVSMYFIPSMMLIGQANVIQIIIAFVVLVLSVPFIFKISAKYFKEGVLDTGVKKKSKKQLKENEIKETSIRQIQEAYLLKKDFSRYGFVIGVSVILFVVMQFASSVIMLPILSIISEFIEISSSNINSIASIITFVVSLVIPTLFVMAYIPKNNEKHDDESKKIELDVWIKSILIAVPLVTLLQIVLSIVLEKLGLNYDIIDKVDLYDSSSILSKALFFLQIAILPAIFEELYIRKAVLNYSKKYGIGFAIISSSLLFSLIHLNISQSVFAFVMGIILAVITVRCKSIIPAGIVHFLNNGYAAIITIFEGNILVESITTLFMLILGLVGVIIMIIEIIKARYSIKEYIMKLIKKDNTKQDGNMDINVNMNSKENNEIDEEQFGIKLSKGYKYILCDYIFIISVILILVMLVLTQNMLSVL